MVTENDPCYHGDPFDTHGVDGLIVFKEVKQKSCFTPFLFVSLVLASDTRVDLKKEFIWIRNFQ